MARPGEVVPASARARRPVVVWNATRACNLACAHCYASAKSSPASDELDHDEAVAFIDDLAAFGVPAVLLSGGEPLTRSDLLALVEHGIARGLRFTLSTNGTLIDDRVARALSDVGITYAGISLDGAEPTHDRLRRCNGAWRSSVRGLRSLYDRGVKRGVRFTLTPDTVADLDAVLAFAATERVERVCVYHLVPAGRGARLADITPEQRRDAVERVFEFAVEHPDVEVLTVDNPSDGAALCRWLEQRDQAAARRCRRALAWNGGARHGPGVGIAAVDERGDVHVDQFSRHHTVGNVRDRPFSAIWSDPTDPQLRALRDAERRVPSRCAECAELALCGGGSRTRAEAATGDPWGFDPSCSLLGARCP
jgi:radical SAM protein with 4Fe4S-binding SPASM domain